jgi:hypothetical protein
MILFRVFLISLVVYLLFRSFMKLGEHEKTSSERTDQGINDKTSGKRISKEIGEVIDYEELDKK